MVQHLELEQVKNSLFDNIKLFNDCLLKPCNGNFDLELLDVCLLQSSTPDEVLTVANKRKDLLNTRLDRISTNLLFLSSYLRS